MKMKNLKLPSRDPDYVHPDRDTKYWWSPEWRRQLKNGKLYRIRAIERDGKPVIQTLSRKGTAADIRGRIAEAYKAWSDKYMIDMILLGENDEWPDDWDDYEDISAR